MLSDSIFINRDSTVLDRNNPIYVVEGSLYAVADIVDDMESNPYYFADASETN